MTKEKVKVKRYKYSKEQRQEWQRKYREKEKANDKGYQTKYGHFANKSFEVKCPSCGDKWMYTFDVKYKYCSKDSCRKCASSDEDYKLAI